VNEKCIGWKVVKKMNIETLAMREDVIWCDGWIVNWVEWRNSTRQELGHLFRVLADQKNSKRNSDCESTFPVVEKRHKELIEAHYKLHMDCRKTGIMTKTLRHRLFFVFGPTNIYSTSLLISWRFNRPTCRPGTDPALTAEGIIRLHA
jgi:hypothetical protein